MKRPLKPEDHRLWSMVTATVHPLHSKGGVRPAPDDALPSPSWGGTDRGAIRVGSQRSGTAPEPDLPTRPARSAVHPPHRGEGQRPIEPNRRHRIAREREEIGGRIDLHGLTQDRARAALERFLLGAWNEGYRAVLVITGKGVQGDGVLRRRVPDWLGAPHLTDIVAGISEAHRRHGGEGALYVALKRKARG